MRRSPLIFLFATLIMVACELPNPSENTNPSDTGPNDVTTPTDDNANEPGLDTDGDGILDATDQDDDDDGVNDDDDAFPLDAAEDTDTDGDMLGNNADPDDDDDTVLDEDDAFPLDASEDTDTDSDGTGDNADSDDDGDGVNDAQDIAPRDDAYGANHLPVITQLPDLVRCAAGEAITVSSEILDADAIHQPGLSLVSSTCSGYSVDATHVEGTCVASTICKVKLRASDPMGYSAVSAVTIIPDNIVFVRPVATGAADGSSWDDATSSVNDAVETASGSADSEVWIHKGSYDVDDGAPLTPLSTGATLWFGGATTQTHTSLNRQTLTHDQITQTTVGGNASGRLVNDFGGPQLTIYGLTLDNRTGGRPTQGGCIYSNGGLTLENVIVRHCRAGSDAAANYNWGGAIYDAAGPLVVLNSYIYDNTLAVSYDNNADYPTGDLRGGGIFAQGDVSMENSHVFANEVSLTSWMNGGTSRNVWARGGGIYSEGDLEVYDSSVTGNTIYVHQTTDLGQNANAHGAGVYVLGEAIINGSRLDQNTATVTNLGSTGGASDVMTEVGGVGGIFKSNLNFTNSSANGNRVNIRAEKIIQDNYIHTHAYGIGIMLDGYGSEVTGKVVNSSFNFNSIESSKVCWPLYQCVGTYWGVGAYIESAGPIEVRSVQASYNELYDSSHSTGAGGIGMYISNYSNGNRAKVSDVVVSHNYMEAWEMEDIIGALSADYSNVVNASVAHNSFKLTGDPTMTFRSAGFAGWNSQLIHSSIADNDSILGASAVYQGGAIFAWGPEPATYANSFVYGNPSPVTGGISNPVFTLASNCGELGTLTGANYLATDSGEVLLAEDSGCLGEADTSYTDLWLPDYLSLVSIAGMDQPLIVDTGAPDVGFHLPAGATVISYLSTYSNGLQFFIANPNACYAERVLTGARYAIADGATADAQIDFENLGGTPSVGEKFRIYCQDAVRGRQVVAQTQITP